MPKSEKAAPASSGEPGDVLENCIMGIAAGERDALARLYRETRESVYGFALSLVQNCHDAEDVVQDVYVRIWESAAGYRPMGKPLAWIFTITRNVSLMCIRRQNRTAPTDLSDWEELFAGEPGVSPEDKVVLSRVMSLLKEEDRQIVILHVVAGMKHKEIAKLMGMKLSTVLSRYNRALTKLREALEEA